MNTRVAIVTGGSAGIGRAIADALVEEGYTTISFDKQKKDYPAGKIKGESGKYVFKECDISDENQVKSAVNDIVEKYDDISVLINNAGIIERRESEEIETSKWDKVFAVNTRGTFLLCKYVTPIMKEQKRGRIINISSVSAKVGDITSAPGYGPSKSAVEGLTKTFALELAPYNATVNSIAPHAIKTEMSSEWSDEKRERVISDIPMGRMGRTEEVAEAVKYLISENAGFVTGETIDINGGFLMD